MIELLSGFISGIISGTGMGGGIVLIILLTIFLNTEQKIAQSTNLIFYIPTAIAAIYINIKQKNIDFKNIIITIIFAIIGSIIGSKITQNINVNVLKKFFAVFLLILAIHEIYVLIKMYNLSKDTNNKIN